MSETKQITIQSFPLEWQIIVRATQSLTSKARDGADITITKEDNYFAFVSKKTSLEVVYRDATLELVWKKYKLINDEKVPTFIKTYKKRMEENEARKLMNTWFEKILNHIDYKSNITWILDDFYYLYKFIEEEKKQEAKQ